jgi:hypothetical protein
MKKDFGSFMIAELVEDARKKIVAARELAGYVEPRTFAPTGSPEVDLLLHKHATEYPEGVLGEFWFREIESDIRVIWGCLVSGLPYTVAGSPDSLDPDDLMLNVHFPGKPVCTVFTEDLQVLVTSACAQLPAC